MLGEDSWEGPSPLPAIDARRLRYPSAAPASSSIHVSRSRSPCACTSTDLSIDMSANACRERFESSRRSTRSVSSGILRCIVYVCGVPDGTVAPKPARNRIPRPATLTRARCTPSPTTVLAACPRLRSLAQPLSVWTDRGWSG